MLTYLIGECQILNQTARFQVKLSTLSTTHLVYRRILEERCKFVQTSHGVVGQMHGFIMHVTHCKKQSFLQISLHFDLLNFSWCPLHLCFIEIGKQIHGHPIHDYIQLYFKSSQKCVPTCVQSFASDLVQQHCCCCFTSLE